jgi:hypothetical protein
MELHIKERFYLMRMLPQTNTFMDYNLKNEIIKKAGITEADKEKFNIQQQPDMITWDVELDMKNPLVVGFTNQELQFIRKASEAIVDTAYPDDFWAFVEKIYNTQAEE